MKILLTGADGQLGQVIQKVSKHHEITPVDVGQLDICDAAAVDRFVGELRPQVIINAAAYTAVDKAESQSELAHNINAAGPANLAAAAQKYHARLLHVSTDYVFDGHSFRPYEVDDATNPMSVYGKTKLDGETAVLAGCSDRAIVRTAWLYSEFGNNFVKTMLKLMKERPVLNVVADQIGTPTAADTLAKCLLLLAETDGQGIYHCTDAGVASWYDFASSIRRVGECAGLLPETAAAVRPIPSSAYPTPAVRPVCAVLSKKRIYEELNFEPVHWQNKLLEVLKEIK